MKNKGFIVFLTVIVTLLCIYYLSFTLVSGNIQEKANEYATDESGVLDQSLKRQYLDSIRNEPIYNLLGIKYTLEEVNETKLNLGLDLQGGMHVLLEVSPVDIIRGLSGGSEDADFQQALTLAQEYQRQSQERFTDLFLEAWNEVAPDRDLSSIFATAANRGRISFDSSDQEVIGVIREEVESAIDRTFNILRTRIDRFGTTAPNIQRLPGTGRIQVELPGADDPDRVRRLLQRVAKLEFWEVYDLNNIAPSLQAINQKWVEENQASATDLQALQEEDEGGVEEIAEALNPGNEEESLGEMLQEDVDQEVLQPEYVDSVDSLEDDLATQLAQGDSASLDSLMNNQVSPLFSLLQAQGGLIYNTRDTSKINRIIQREDMQDLLPRDLRLLWSNEPRVMNGGEELLELYPIRTARGNEAPLTGEVITDARQDFDQSGNPSISMQMNATGAKTWRRLTSENVGNRIAVVLDNYVYSAPVVQNEIPNGNSQITGNFTIEEAQDLSNILKAGSLPARARIVEEAIVGPTLGKEAQAQGVTSIVAGLVLVVVFMIIYYAKGGLVANAALVFNIFFVLGILAQLNAALTLPGIAGIVLTIGMAIDANVLIFERIREELRLGATLRNAISTGYDKAFSSIIDANVTTFLTGVILYVFGQGPVRGFATTLMIGIASSFFSAVFITRVIVTWMTRKGDQSKLSFSNPFTRNLLTGLSLDFLGKRKIAYAFSGVVIGLGMILLVFEGGLNLGVDFKGGRSYVVEFREPMTASDVKVALTDDFEEAGTEVKTYGANNILKITTSYLVDDESEEADANVQNALIGGVAEFSGKSFTQDAENLGEDEFAIVSSSKVGATIADDIRNASLEAVFFALIVIFLYILVRFRKWQFGLGAVAAVFHDTLFVIAAFAIARLFGKAFEVDQVFIAAMLTIIGYSINDTVVVFDRIRENLGLRPSSDLIKTFNISLNDTISRTLITSATTFVVVLVLLIFGGEVLRGFSFSLLVGILVGTYSSIFIATPIVVDLNKKKLDKTAESLKSKPKKSKKVSQQP
ncbi:MAG: protein translocase subunit SecDF [Candidatus Cyclobacteriaceae bacterium M3_2C_046]